MEIDPHPYLLTPGPLDIRGEWGGKGGGEFPAAQQAMISDELERKMEEIFDTTCPDMYLRQLYDTPEKLKSFAIYLRSALPPRVDINYYHKKNIPVAPVDRRPGEGVYCVELLCCGFAQECSLKPSVSTKVAKQLIGEYAKYDFIIVY